MGKSAPPRLPSAIALRLPAHVGQGQGRAPLPIFGAEGVSGVINGRLYVLPGACSGERPDLPGYCAEEPTRRFFRYDPTTNTWIPRRQAPHVHRKGAAAVLGGKLYVAGGLDGFDPVNALDVYDPGTNQWSTRASIPEAGLARSARCRPTNHPTCWHVPDICSLGPEQSRRGRRRHVREPLEPRQGSGRPPLEWNQWQRAGVQRMRSRHEPAGLLLGRQLPRPARKRERGEQQSGA